MSADGKQIDAQPEGPQFTWQELLAKLTTRQDLTVEETGWAMNEIMSGTASSVLMAVSSLPWRRRGRQSMSCRASRM